MRRRTGSRESANSVLVIGGCERTHEIETTLLDSDERAVSPVIGVVLMVAIIVVLLCVIAVFVLDLGQGQSSSAAAGITFDEDGTNVTTTVVQIQRGDAFYVEAYNDNHDVSYWIGSDGNDGHQTDRDGLKWGVGDWLTMDSDSPTSAGINSSVAPSGALVIGVILMVAITVILAAVIATFVLDLGQSQSASASASAQFDESGDEVTTTLIQIDRGDRFYVQVEHENGTTYWVSPDANEITDDDNARTSGDHGWDVGNSLTINTSSSSAIGASGDGPNGDEISRIAVIGVQDGSDTLIQDWEA